MLITFSGLDGAGKSTMIAWLRAELEAQHRPVTVLHLNEQVGVYAYLRALRDWALRRPQRPDRPPRMEKRPAGLGRWVDTVVWSKTVRRILYPIDLLLFLVLRGWIEKLGGRILITDRYFYDRLVDVAGERGWAWLRFLASLTPRPDLSVFLEITPEAAFARKREYNVAYLRRRAAAYGQVLPWVPSLRLSGEELDAAKRTLARVVRERLAA